MARITRAERYPEQMAAVNSCTIRARRRRQRKRNENTRVAMRYFAVSAKMIARDMESLLLDDEGRAGNRKSSAKIKAAERAVMKLRAL